MSWQKFLSSGSEQVTLPWVGGRVIQGATQTWDLVGHSPVEHGWYQFKITGRLVRDPSRVDPVGKDVEQLRFRIRGYLVGDRILKDGIKVDPNPKRISGISERVHLLEPGLDRFVRVVAGRVYPEGPLVFVEQDMPQGPEDDVLRAYMDEAASLDGIKGVSPALDAAFRMECWQRAEAARRRAELERRLREEEERRRAEELRQEIILKLGDGRSRRELAKQDFGAAASAALRVGGATLIDQRVSHHRAEYVVRFRLDGRRYECVCDQNLRIIDSGICLTDHDTGEKGDTWLTLESLPSVIREADRERKLVVYRHV